EAMTLCLLIERDALTERAALLLEWWRRRPRRRDHASRDVDVEQRFRREWAAAPSATVPAVLRDRRRGRVLERHVASPFCARGRAAFLPRDFRPPAFGPYSPRRSAEAGLSTLCGAAFR